MLSPNWVATFERDGFVRLPAAFAREAAQAMLECVWAELERVHGLRRDRPAGWTMPFATGLQAIKDDPVFEPIGGPATCAGLDALFGPGAWRRPRQWGGIHTSFPEAAPHWTLPGEGWHFDFHLTESVRPLCGLTLFSLLDDLEPEGGGTLLVRGSHRYVERFASERSPAERSDFKAMRKAVHQSDPWLAELWEGVREPARVRSFLEHTHEADGLPLQVAELHGCAGDVVYMHPWTLHARSPNVRPTPRVVRIVQILRERAESAPQTAARP